MRSLGAVTVLALLAAACRPSGSGVRSAEMGSFRAASAPAEADPTIRSARLLPETVDDTTANYGSEPGGGLRVIAAGLRLVTSSKGALVAAEDRFPQSPTSTTVLPERLGGGFLFLIGNTIWRADRWLGPAKPIFTSPQQVQAIVPGLDRLYIRAQNVVLAIDGRTGESLDLGPWPASPYVASYGAADGWRAAAVTDMRGVVATFDAGATWRALDLAMDPKQVVVSNDSLAIGGFENGRTEAWYEVRPDGSIARLGAAPHDVKLKLAAPTTSRTTTYGGSPTAGGIVISTAKAPVHGTTTTVLAAPDPRPAAEPDKEDVAAKIFGKRPLAAAIEDGWPLADGTAVIARDGALARVNLTDGTLIELVRDAFPLKPARCHPITLTRPTAIGAFGFVCGEPRGATILYAYEPLRGRLAELKRFDKPRVVTSSGNGALAIRGPCAEDGEPVPSPRPEPVKLEKSKDGKDDDAASTEKTKSKADAKASVRAKEVPPPEAKAADAKALSAPSSEVHPYCVLGHDGAWKEIHVRGDVGGERVVVLADGRIVVVSPPEALGTPGRITLLDKGRATTAPITFPRVPTDVGRVLRLGFWLDGFEERRPGVVGGWIEAGGVMLGVEIKLDGKATPGQLVRDAGMPFVSGKYGLGWTASRRGYETTDGGMTWTSIDLPDPLVPIGRVERRACGPIGCLAQGWLRIGWGGPKQGAAPPPSPPVRPTTANLPVPRVQLACEPVASMPPQVPTAKAKPAASTTPAHPPRFGSLGGPPVLASFNGLSELPPFFSHAAPVLHDSERGLNVDVGELVDRFPKVSVGRVYGWGPKTGEWDTLGRWQVKWLSPFAGWPEVRASLPSLPPPMIVDMTRALATYYGSYSNVSFQLAPGDDPSHALLVGKLAVRSERVLFEVESEHAPVEVRRADGEPFGEIEGIVRTSGRWFVATAPSPGVTSPMTVIWQVEGGIARELVRVPRAIPEGQSSAFGRTKLARRSDGRAIGLVADGQPTTNVRWVLPIALENGTIGEPEPLGYVDLAGRTLDACTDDVAGWVVDTTMPASSVTIRLPQASGSLSGVLARLRLTQTRACIERLAGTYDGGQSREAAAHLSRPGAGAARSTAPLRTGEFFATAMSMQTRFPLKCAVTK